MFRPKKAPLLNLSDIFAEKARADLVEMELVIAGLIVKADDGIKTRMFFEDAYGVCLSSAAFYFHVLNCKRVSTRICEDLQNGSPGMKHKIIKKEGSLWLNNVQKAAIVEGKEAEKKEDMFSTELLVTLLRLHIVFDTVLQKIDKTNDETGIVKFEVLNKTYRSLLLEMAPFRKRTDCIDYYNKIGAHLASFQDERIALHAESSCCCKKRKSVKVKLGHLAEDALAGVEGAINKAASSSQNLELSDEISMSFIQFEKEIEKSCSTKHRVVEL